MAIRFFYVVGRHEWGASTSESRWKSGYPATFDNGSMSKGSTLLHKYIKKSPMDVALLPNGVRSRGPVRPVHPSKKDDPTVTTLHRGERSRVTRRSQPLRKPSPITVT